MATGVTVVDNVNIAKYSDKLENDKGLWTFAANTWYKLLEPYTPMDTGKLFGSVLISDSPTKIIRGLNGEVTVTIEPKQIHYVMEYAPAVYKGDHMNFQKIHHKWACARWDKVAMPTQGPKLVRSLEKYIKAKGLLK